jgi:isocitrate/isopropylmalate dehydrogenase
MTVRVLALPGDDAAPEAVRPSVALLKRLAPTVVWEELPSGEEGLARYGREGFTRLVQEAIDRCHTTLFGAGSGKTPGTTYLALGQGHLRQRPPRALAPGLSKSSAPA